MRLTPSSFEIDEWTYDKSLFTNNNNFAAYGNDLSEEPTFQTIVPKPIEEKKFPVVFLGIRWIYDLLYKGKSIIHLSVKDVYFANLENRQTDFEEVNNMIIESYERFTKEFNTKKKDGNIVFKLPELEPDTINQVRIELLTDLRKNGF